MENQLVNLWSLDFFQKITIWMHYLNSQDQLGPFCFYLKTIKERQPITTSKAVTYTKLFDLWCWKKWNLPSFGSYLYSLNIDLGELCAPNFRFIQHPYAWCSDRKEAAKRSNIWHSNSVLVLNYRSGFGTLLKNVIYISKVLPGLLHLLFLSVFCITVRALLWAFND